MESNHAISTVEIKQQIQTLQAEKRNVRDQIDAITTKIMTPVVDDRSAWERARDGSFLEIDTKSSLREELEMLEGQERFIEEALKGGKAELDRARGQESLLVCAEARSAVIAAAKKILMGLQQVEQGNREYQRIRDGIHEQGFESGSLPVVIYVAGGRWGDPSGGCVVDYCKYISANCPELAQLANSKVDK